MQFSEIASRVPSDQPDAFAAATAAFRRGDYENCLALLNAGAAPTDTAAKRLRMLAAFRAGDFTVAREAAQQLAQTEREAARVLRAADMLENNDGQFPIEADAPDMNAHVCAALVSLGRYAEAGAAASAHLLTRPADPAALFVYALSRAATDAAQETPARPLPDSSRKTLRRDLLLWASRMRAANRLAEARIGARALAWLDPTDAATQAFSEQVKKSRLSDARKKVVRRSPDALRITSQLLADYPFDTAAMRLHARALIMTRLYGDAEKVLSALIGRTDVCADDHVQLARVFRATRAADKAIDACFAALTLDHENALALHLLGQLLPSRK